MKYRTHAVLAALVLVGIMTLPTATAEAQAGPYNHTVHSTSQRWIGGWGANDYVTTEPGYGVLTRSDSDHMQGLAWSSNRSPRMNNFEFDLANSVIHDWSEGSDLSPIEFSYSWKDDRGNASYRSQMFENPADYGCTAARFSYRLVESTIRISYKQSWLTTYATVKIWSQEQTATCVRNGGGGAGTDRAEEMHHDGTVRINGHCGACGVPPIPPPVIPVVVCHEDDPRCWV